MTTTFDAPGIVRVTAPGVYRLSEMRDEAAQRFTDELERVIDWPTLADVIETPGGDFIATYVLEGVA